MAGTKNLFNTDPLEVITETLERSNGIRLQREYVTITIATDNGATTLVTVSPNPVAGYCPYVEGISFQLDKLDVSGRIPHDMCYSGEWPATSQQFATFMLTSYGLLLLPEQWEVVRGDTVFPLDGSIDIGGDLTEGREITLRTTQNHPLFVEGMSIPLFVTNPTENFGVLSLNIMGDEEGLIGDEANVQFVPAGGLPPYLFTLLEGSLPAEINEDGSGLTGSYNVTGQFDFTIQVEDSTGQTAQASGVLSILLGQFTVVMGAPNGTLGVPYSHQYECQGGVPPYRVRRVYQIPMGLELTQGGLLHGTPDAGEHDIVIGFEDSIGDRFTLYDTIQVAGRDNVIVRLALKEALTDWLELGAGYSAGLGLQSHPSGSSWEAVNLVSANKRGPIAGALDIHYGYLAKTNVQQPLSEIAVAMMVSKGYMSMGGCLFSNLGNNVGFDIRVGDQNDSQLRITAWVNGEVYGLVTPENVEVLTDTPALITVQVAGGTLSIHRDATLIAWTQIPDSATSLLASSPFTVGRQSNYTSGYQWNGTVSQVMVFNQRLWGDQIAYLSNGGVGIQYWQLTDETDYWVSPLQFMSTDAQAQVGVPFDQVVVQVGTRPIIHGPILCDGALPSGMTLDVSDLQNWRVIGTPTQAGTYISYWVGQGEKEVKGVQITIVVAGT
jgi:hypothetical protein